MGKMVRLDEDVHQMASFLAKEEDRSLTKIINRVLRASLEVGEIGVPENEAPRNNLGGATELPADKFAAVADATVVQAMEKGCCLGNKPCVHWSFDGVEEIWVNSLSGRTRNE